MKKLLIIILVFSALIGCHIRQKNVPDAQVTSVEPLADCILPGYPEPNKIREDQQIVEISGTKRNIPLIVKAIVTKDVRLLSEYTVFPLSRKKPFSDIENLQQLEESFDVLFDDDLINDLRNSGIDDWVPLGWRGYCYKQGELWVYDKLTTINYVSSQK